MRKMQVTDARLNDAEKLLLASLIGKTLDKFRCEAYDAKIRSAAWGVVGLFLDDRVIAIERKQEVLSYYGELDEVAVTRVRETNPEGIVCKLIGSKMADHAVGKVIQDILLYEDSEYKFHAGVDLYRFDMTTAIVLQFERTQLALSGTPIMELIDIHQGPDAEKRIPRLGNDDEYAEEFRVERAVVSLKNWAAECGR